MQFVGSYYAVYLTSQYVLFHLKFWYIFLNILSQPHILRRRSQRTIRINTQKWSEISVKRIPLTSLEIIQNILSIKVVLNSALLVGLFISGRKEKEFIASINWEVRTCLSAFRRLMLKSPIKYTVLFSRFNVVNINISCSVNIVMSVLGGLYKFRTTTFFYDIICDLSNSITLLPSCVQYIEFRPHLKAQYIANK